MRRLFALFALLSGLAAIGMPVAAAMQAGASEQVAGSETPQQSKQTQSECKAERRQTARKSGDGKVCRQHKPDAIHIPTIQFGADRAYE